MTLREIFNNVVALLGVKDAEKSSLAMRAEAFSAIRAALQQVQTAGEDYYGREEVTVELVADTGSYALAKEVQTVLDHPRIGSRTLKKLTSRSRYDNYGPLFLGKLSRAVASGTPLAYYVEPLRDTTADEPDSVKINLLIVPPSAAPGAMLVPVIKEPPIYVDADLCDETEPPIPHKYHESILLPLCRWNITSSSFFSDQELVPALKDDYARAMMALGFSDPRVQPSNKQTQAQPAEASA